MKERVALGIAIAIVAVMSAGPRTLIAGGWILELQLLHRLDLVNGTSVFRFLEGFI